VRLSLKTN